jgi:methionyl-tRNA synthetase
MSKSLRNVIDPFELVQKYGTDAVRYFLLRESSPFEDLDFTFEKFEKRYNSDLAAGLGNLTARVITLAQRSKIPPFSEKKLKKKDLKIKMAIEKTLRKYKKAMEEFKFNEALATVWELVNFCDRYIQEKRPWEKKEEQKEIISNLLFSLSQISQFLEPFLPQTAEKIEKQIAGKKVEHLFPKV